MPRYDASSGECWISVYREGMLASVGHDLRLRVKSWTLDLEVDPPSARAELDTGSVEVVGTLHGDVVDPTQLSDQDRDEIERRIRDEVLETHRHPRATFRATRIVPGNEGYQVRGFLALHGVERLLDLLVSVAGERATARTTIDHTAFGIRQVKAFLGALRVKTDAEIEIAVELRARSS
jgi:YceI-like protein